MTFNEIRDELQKILPQKRFYHTIGVSDTAMMLGALYGQDMNALRLAGLLHDCAKGYKISENVELCENAGIEVTDAERINPQLLHAKLGAYFAKEIYGVTDTNILDAIACHTTGKIGMTFFEKILFVADYIEPCRDRAKRLQEIRTEAFNDIDKCLIMILEDTLSYLNELGIEPDMTTQSVYDYYKGETNGRN